VNKTVSIWSMVFIFVLCLVEIFSLMRILFHAFRLILISLFSSARKEPAAPPGAAGPTGS
jgi:hypothetical protein